MTTKKASNRKELISPGAPVPESWNGRSRKSAFSLRGNDGSNLPPAAEEMVEMWPPLARLDPRRRVRRGLLAGILTSFETLVVTAIEIPNVRFWPDSRGPALTSGGPPIRPGFVEAGGSLK